VLAYNSSVAEPKLASILPQASLPSAAVAINVPSVAALPRARSRRRV